MAMTIEQEREAFEKWADENDRNTSMLYGEYVNDTTDSAWDAWQARAHLSQPAQAMDVGAIREVIDALKGSSFADGRFCKEQVDKLTRALSAEKAGSRNGKWCDCGMVRLPHLKGEFIGCTHYCRCDGCGGPVIGGPYGFPDVLCRVCALPTSPTPDKEGDGCAN